MSESVCTWPQDWFPFSDGSNAELQAKIFFKKGGSDALNIYTTLITDSDNGGDIVLGFSSFPWCVPVSVPAASQLCYPEIVLSQ